MILKIVFFISISILVWTYVLYPLLMAIVVLIDKRLIRKKRLSTSIINLPTLDFLIFTYNEQNTIEKKIINSLALIYPKNKLHLYLVDSGSTDKTLTIVNKYQKRGIIILRQAKRKGKASAINFAISKTKSEIIFFTDANSFLDRKAVLNITRHFSNQKIGGVCGRFEARSDKKTIIAEGGSIYWKNIEKILREGESILGNVIHLSGEISAIRRKVFKKLDEKNLGEDFDLTLKIINQGYNLTYEPKAYAYEKAPDNLKDFFTQKRRIIAGSLQTIWNHRKFIFNPEYGIYSLLILPSHKLLPILSPFFFLVTFIIFFKLIKIDLFYFYISVLLILAIIYLIKGRQFLAILYYFLISIMALVLAWYDFIFGKTNVIWEKIESSRKI